MYSEYYFSNLDEWLGLEKPKSSVTTSSERRNPLQDIRVKHVKNAPFGYRVTELKSFFLKRVFIYKNISMGNRVSLCSSVTGGSAGRVVPTEEVLASAEIARQRNRRDWDLITLMYPSNAKDWTWIEHADGTWTGHHSIIFEEAV